MRLTSLLFVPADSAKKFDKARGCGADGLILDLEDSVAPANKAAARETLKGWIEGSAGTRDWSFWVRVNPLDTGLTADDLKAVVRPGLDGIILNEPLYDGSFMYAEAVAAGADRFDMFFWGPPQP